MSKDVLLKNAVLAWNSQYFSDGDNGQIAIYDRNNHIPRKFRSTALAVFSDYSKMNQDRKKLQLMLELWHAVVRDGIDPRKAHEACLVIPEYRSMCAEDLI